MLHNKGKTPQSNTNDNMSANVDISTHCNQRSKGKKMRKTSQSSPNPYF